MTFFDVRIATRIRVDELKEIEKIVNKNQDKYETISHFVRAAIIKKIEEEKK